MTQKNEPGSEEFANIVYTEEVDTPEWREREVQRQFIRMCRSKLTAETAAERYWVYVNVYTERVQEGKSNTVRPWIMKEALKRFLEWKGEKL